MTIYLQCPTSNNKSESMQEMMLTVERWATSAAIRNLIKSFGGAFPEGLKIPQLMDWLVNFSDRWDYRNLQRNKTIKEPWATARWLVKEQDFSYEQKKLIAAAVVELGLVNIGTPPKDSYDFILILGGGRLANLMRPRLTAHLLNKGYVKTKYIVLLSSMRPVADSERKSTDTYAPGASSEYDLVNAGAEQSFDIEDDYDERIYKDPINENLNWAVRRYKLKTGLPEVISLAAPSSDPYKRRANSADTFDFFISQHQIQPGNSLLLITSQIYVPYQQLEAIRILAIPHNLNVDTIGYPPDWNHNLSGIAQPCQYLQEIRSAIQSAQRLIKLPGNKISNRDL